MKTYKYELREDIVNIILGVLNKVQIVGSEAEAIVAVKQVMMKPLQEEQEKKNSETKK